MFFFFLAACAACVLYHVGYLGKKQTLGWMTEWLILELKILANSLGELIWTHIL